MKLAFGNPGASIRLRLRANRTSTRPYLAILAAWVFTSTLNANAAKLQILKGHVPKAAKMQQSIGALDASARLDLAIGLPLRNTNQLKTLVQQISQPGSTNFRHYLSPEEFTERFGPRVRDYQAVRDFLTANNFKITGVHPNQTMIDVNASVADIEKAFHIKMRQYPHPTEARQFFAPDAEPSVELDTPLLAISGLDNFTVPHPLLRRNLHSAIKDAHPLTGSGSGGAYQGKDFLAAYLPGVTLTGAGQSVGLFELDGFKATDISTYNTEASLPALTPTTILVDGFNGSASEEAGDDEVALDIDMVHAVAPKAAILVYEGPSPSLVENVVTPAITTTHINDILNRMATDKKALQLSCSWGFDINATTVQIFEQYAAQGQSFFLACGDDGAFAGAVDEPADDPYITVVGGTELTTSGPAGSWVSETTWNSSSSRLGEAATGGGISIAYPIPYYQQGISMSANGGSTTMRNVPDVALIADNVWVVANGSGTEVGGTSVASPLWAAIIALANEQGAASGLPPVGFANPALYAIAKSANYAACYHDITTGNNTSSESPNNFFAVAGFDLCTGWGTPSGTNLIQALLAPPAENLVVTSPFGFTAIGPVGGPFSVTSQTYTLTNVGDAPLNWSLVNTSSWLTASSASGTLNPGGAAASVTVSLNSAATNSLIQSYDANIVFNNLSDGFAQNREFDLLVGNGGFETGDFTGWTLNGSTNDNFALAADDSSIDGEAAIQGVKDWQLVHSGLYGALLGQVTSVAYLSQTIPTTPGQSYNLSFWLTSVADKGSTTPNQFLVTWNGTTLLSETNVGAFPWTNYHFTVSATSSSTTLQFGNREDPAAWGLDDINVQPITAASFQPVTQNAGTINLAWSAFPGQAYQLQYTDSLSPTNWINFGGPITATNNVVATSDNLVSTSQRFYRILLLAQ
jgi:hypothetical protein